jgi:hypothetical protein
MQAVDVAANPFAVLSFIVAPAILTNASSTLAMSTSNRLARAVDRARELSRQLEESSGRPTPETERRMRELLATERRSLLLVKALRSVYASMGAFAGAALLSLLGAAAITAGWSAPTPIFEIVAAALGLFAVGALVHCSALLVHETRIVVHFVRERADDVRRRIASGGD